MTDPATRCGFVCIIGPPNVGKSTLVNRLTGAKVSIVTPRAQTTRTRILGVRIDGPAQAIFIDTPGVFTPRSRLDHGMLAAARRAAMEADLILVLAGAKNREAATQSALTTLGLTEAKVPLMLIVNKIDLVARTSLLSLVDTLNQYADFAATFMISARRGQGVADVATAVARALPRGVWLFPEDEATNSPQRMMACELTREQVFLQLRQELPYAAAVEAKTWQEFDNGDLRLEQTIIVERDSQKGIVVGKGGQRIKQIGAAARREIAAALGRRVHLCLQVKVQPGWRDNIRRLRALGLA